jgi:hypothetical protein
MKLTNSVSAVQHRGEAVRDPWCCEMFERIHGGAARQRIELHPSAGGFSLICDCSFGRFLGDMLRAYRS